MNDKIWAGEVGQTYEALEHTYEENVAILGRPLADEIEKRRLTIPAETLPLEVVSVNFATKTITVGRK